MTKDEIYDHLAQVYLGKSQSGKSKNLRKKKQFRSWLMVNVIITGFIFAGSIYGLSAFLTHKEFLSLKSKVVYSLHEGPITLSYDFRQTASPIKQFSLNVSSLDASSYQTIRFSVRAREEGSPGMMKVVVTNEHHEQASFYVRDIDFSWKEVSIPLEQFQQISDWTNLTDISFVLESWNVEKSKGIVLIDDVRFATKS